MNAIDCPCESDVLAAVSTGRWPDRVDEELRRHAASCGICQDVIAVARAFACTEAEAMVLPDASAVWLKAQIRVRAEAMRLAERPITVAQAVGFAAAVGGLGAVLGASSLWLQSVLAWLGGSVARLDPRGLELPPALLALLVEHAGVAALVAGALLAMPLVVYWAVRDA